MKRFFLALLLALAAIASLRAQQPVITPDTQVDSPTIHQWLHSGDPRMIAWAAYFAWARHDSQAIAEMPGLLEHWALPPKFDSGEAQAAQGHAILAVVDTLIRENAPVPVSTVKAVARTLPAQALILITRLPLSESSPTLNEWLYGEEGSWPDWLKARAAMMILAKKPVPNLVSRVLLEAQEQMNVQVARTTAIDHIQMGGACADSFSRKPTPGWPPVYNYDLVENDPGANAEVIVDLGGDRIQARRFPENMPGGSCHLVKPLNAQTRHRLIAYWLGINTKEMPWQPEAWFPIVWTNKAAYERELGTLIETQREKMRATVEALRDKGLLTDNLAATITPKLIVSVRCDRDLKPCPIP